MRRVALVSAWPFGNGTSSKVSWWVIELYEVIGTGEIGGRRMVDCKYWVRYGEVCWERNTQVCSPQLVNRAFGFCAPCLMDSLSIQIRHSKRD